MKMFIVIVGLVFSLLPSSVHALDVTIKPSVTLGWRSEMGKFYAVKACTNLASQQWAVVETSIIGNGEPLERSYIQTNTFTIFRVEEVQPDFRNATLFQKDFGDITGVHFEDADVTRCSFTNGVLQLTHFERSFILGSRFDGADMRLVNFNGASIFMCSFVGVPSFRQTFLGHTTIFSCDFTGGVDFTDVSFEGATLYLCDFTGARNLNLTGANCVWVTLPDGTVRTDP